MLKTNKQKCLEMWLWLRRNPGKWKMDYLRYLNNNNRVEDWNDCWACETVASKSDNASRDCKHCPIEWIPGAKKLKRCISIGSPYSFAKDNWWKENQLDKYLQSVDKIIILINNWKEEGHFKP